MPVRNVYTIGVPWVMSYFLSHKTDYFKNNSSAIEDGYCCLCMVKFASRMKQISMPWSPRYFISLSLFVNETPGGRPRLISETSLGSWMRSIALFYSQFALAFYFLCWIFLIHFGARCETFLRVHTFSCFASHGSANDCRVSFSYTGTTKSTLNHGCGCISTYVHQYRLNSSNMPNCGLAKN